MSEEIIILGRGSTYKSFTWDTTTEVWTTQSVYDFLNRDEQKRITRTYYFHPHEIHCLGNEFGKSLSFKDIPIGRIRSIFGDGMHSSIAWIICTATLEKIDTIKLHGVDLINPVERGSQRDGLFKIMGQCKMMGVKFLTAEKSGIYLPDQLYGLQDFVEGASHD